MTLESIFIGTRVDKGRYGPQSREMAISDLISLIHRPSEPTRIILPDFSGLARHIDGQLREHFSQQQEDEYARKYRYLSDIWYQAGSLSNPDNRSRRFEKVMEQSQEFLVFSQDVMPNTNLYDLKYDEGESVRQKGQMYCLALLFHIIARAAFEPESVATDTTLVAHCRWMKDWVKKTLGARPLDELMVRTAMLDPGFFPALQRLIGDTQASSADEYLANCIRTACQKTSEYLNNPRQSYRMTFNYHSYNNQQLTMLKVLRDLHYRIDRLEMLLQELAKNTEVDFTTADTAGRWITEQIGKVEGNENLGIPANI
ncbi:hypothetical protein [Klebsiella variicola]|uniref:hypothetical protein n=1 Tax=Klebsiella variicola TaxID=244366 RepID=UPI0021C5DA1C|nr:hypothetical protein [Klebsiella variicola]